ncbi:MAG: hypothetical protein WEB53_14765 [Akkermansiaceae bacterium]
MNSFENNQFPSGDAEFDQGVFDDLAIVGMSYLNDGIEDLDSFANALVNEFGEDFHPFAKRVFKVSCLAYNELLSADLEMIPLDLADNIESSTSVVPGRIVYNMVRMFIEQGYSFNVALDFSVILVQEKIPSANHSDILEAFNKFGRIIYPAEANDTKENKNIEELARLLMESLGFDNEIQEIEKSAPPQK